MQLLDCQFDLEGHAALMTVIQCHLQRAVGIFQAIQESSGIHVFWLFFFLHSPLPFQSVGRRPGSTQTYLT